MRLIKGFFLVSCLALSGCWVADTVKFLNPDDNPTHQVLFARYEQVGLKTSTSADVIELIHLPEYELLSQSRSVIASVGKTKRGYKVWFSMVAFDEDELTAKRKYLYMVDERPKQLFVQPWEGLALDSEMVVDAEILDEPYANDNAKRIAVMRWVLEKVREDIDEVKADNKSIAISRNLINQVLVTVLNELDHSPAQAAKLTEEKGLEVKHTSFNKCRIKMLIENGIVTIRIRCG